MSTIGQRHSKLQPPFSLSLLIHGTYKRYWLVPEPMGYAKVKNSSKKGRILNFIEISQAFVRRKFCSIKR
jgi:hypothetical protein